MENDQKYLTKNREKFNKDLLDFISIPSIAALPEHYKDVQRAAVWLRDRMLKAGIENMEIMDTGGQPAVYGDWLHAGSDKPTVLIYGHFDVQPVDPLDLWNIDPFKPIIKDNKIYGRGASDDKGSMFIPIVVFESIFKTSETFPFNIKFIFEGEEEVASPNMPEFVSKNVDKLKCDMIFSADGGQFSEDECELAVAYKGILGFDIEVTGPDTDKHSGLYGAAIANPVMALSQLIASMKNERGEIAVDGFYDDVIPLTSKDREEISRVPFDEKKFVEQTGAICLDGEIGYTPLERVSARPTIDLNGISGGYQGAGTKTVLPSKAFAKITCRLVADQKPKEVLKKIEKHVEKHLPSGVTGKVIPLQDEGDPLLIPSDLKSMKLAKEVLKNIYGKDPYIIRVGGSIPILSAFYRFLGVYTTTFSFQLNDENWHAPNEFFRLSSFYKGQEAYRQLFHKIGSLSF